MTLNILYVRLHTQIVYGCLILPVPILIVMVPDTVADREVPGRCTSPARSNGSRSGTEKPDIGLAVGLATGETTGDV
jgi:hypothetical protein